MGLRRRRDRSIQSRINMAERSIRRGTKETSSVGMAKSVAPFTEVAHARDSQICKERVSNVWTWHGG
ncbi:hypothetical protein TanjilG_28526 [Lupinus angustifolius]|uniref:Uncharacterized protein n=1 Tax=Lupinus angustifolius TaxID=3871 RepID=A0A394DLZ2_LUPAN|nr:hypothetical protein TanjilG_28526 [Lupinus angustifolius]